MNPTDDNLPTIDQQRIDLLVDGELSETERRELLSSLDGIPGAWRRCALAFLEHQSWKEQIRAMRPEPVVRAPVARPVGLRGFPGQSRGTLVAMAASFLIAFGLGVLLHDFWRPGAEVGPLSNRIAEAPQVPAAPTPTNDRTDKPPAATRSGDGWRLVTVPVGIGVGGAGSIQLPARELDRIDQRWLAESTPTIPPDLLQALEESGHEVLRSRRLLPFRLHDGRQLLVPFEQVELRFPDDSQYQ